MRAPLDARSVGAWPHEHPDPAIAVLRDAGLFGNNSGAIILAGPFNRGEV